jgi:hypothetical protein
MIYNVISMHSAAFYFFGYKVAFVHVSFSISMSLEKPNK